MSVVYRVLAMALIWCVILTACAVEQPPPPVVNNNITPTTSPVPSAAVAVAEQETAELPVGRILFVAQGDLWMWQAGELTRLTSDGRMAQPVWSPDGTRIACVQRQASASDLVVLNSDGTGVLRLTDNGSKYPTDSYERIYDTIWAFYPVWSPDGATIAFASQEGTAVSSPATDYNLSLFIIPSSGGKRQQILTDDTAHMGRASYSPSGSQLAYTRFPQREGASQIFLYNRVSGASEPFASVPADSYDPAWSPDGRWLAFAVRTGSTTDIYVVAVGRNGSPIRVTTNEQARAPAWSPDGKTLAFIGGSDKGFQIWTVPFDGASSNPTIGTPAQLTAGSGLDPDSGLSWAESNDE